MVRAVPVFEPDPTKFFCTARFQLEMTATTGPTNLLYPAFDLRYTCSHRYCITLSDVTTTWQNRVWLTRVATRSTCRCPRRSCTPAIGDKPHKPSKFKFPKHSFRQKTVVSRAFQDLETAESSRAYKGEGLFQLADSTPT